MTVVLHDYWRSSASYRVRIALELKGIAHDRAAVDLVAGAQRDPAHLALNPQGLVPVLEIDGLRYTDGVFIATTVDGRLRARGPLTAPGAPPGQAVPAVPPERDRPRAWCCWT